MKYVIRRGLLLSLLGSVVHMNSCEKFKTSDQPGDPVNITTEHYQREVIDSANRLAFDLLKPVLTNPEDTSNMMISPFSITSALSMTLNGAADETFGAIRKTLGLEEKTMEQINNTYLKLMTEMVPVDNHVILDIANSVWVEKHLIVKQPFISALQTWYKAEAREIDAADPGSVDIVNGWIAGKTHDKIKDMLDKLDPGFKLLLINAVYFNGRWRYRFDDTYTREETFYITPAKTKRVPTMHLTQNFKTVKANNSTIVELPYGQGNYTMVLVLPDIDYSVSEVADDLTPLLWNEWMKMLGDNSQKVNISLPKFKYKYKRLLNDDLIALGMGIAFSPDANFSYISDAGLMISRVIHQTFIETNEEGTEAAAATEVIFIGTLPQVTKEIIINRPFLYFIREISTGTILFMGRVNDPALN